MKVINLDGRKVNISEEQLNVLNTLDSCRGGGFATVHHYHSGTDNPKCIRPSSKTINFISRFSYRKWNNKRLNALKDIQLGDLNISDPKITNLNEDERSALFDKAKAELTTSWQNTDDGDTHSDNYRQAHYRCYIRSNIGIKCHLYTADGEINGQKAKIPVLAENGYPTVKSLMVSVLELNAVVHDAGEYKPTNSQKKTIMKNAIEKVATKDMLQFKVISLKDNNFEKISIDHENITAEDLVKIKEYQES